MTYAAEATALRAPIFAASLEDTYRFAWPGADFDPPDATGDTSAPALWIELFVDYDRAEYHAFSGSDHRKVDGTLQFSVYQEQAVDDFPARTAVDALIAAYRAADTEALIFYAERALPREVGIDEGWWRFDVEIPFVRFDS